MVRSRGCSVCCTSRVYWNVNYFGMIRAIAMARAVVDHRERAVPVACWPSTIYGCRYELSIGLTTSLRSLMATAGEERTPEPVLEREIKRAILT